MATTTGTEVLPPPAERYGAFGWVRKRFFGGPVDTVLTLLILYLLYLTLVPFVEWAFVNATWYGDSREDCQAGGACWALFRVRWGQYVYGLYPTGERWRVNLGALLLILASVPIFIDGFKHRLTYLFGLILIYPLIAYFLFYGGVFGLRVVDTARWGGLFLTLVVGLTGIAASLPIGILLALGRRSQLPAIKSLSVVFIEVIRGVPLVSILFMASVMFPLFAPEGVNFDKLLRALVAVALFASAYMAEVIRGGLQAIPKGQYEAADAMGLTYWKAMGLVILPQALKLVIPGIVNTFIGLFKDTALVSIIGLYDLLGMARTVVKDANWLGTDTESYIIAAAGFWVFCFAMSKYSQHLERKLDTGHKS